MNKLKLILENINLRNLDKAQNLCDEYDKEEMIEFVNSLTNEQFEKLKIFFGTMPAILHDIEFTCSKCGCSEKQTLNGIGDFFL